MRKPYRALAALSLSAVTLSGCVPNGLQGTTKDPIAIGVDADDPEQRVLGEIYSRVLQQLGRPTSVTAADFSAGDTLRVLKETPVDFVVTCTGRLVEETDAAAAERLKQEAKDEPAGFSDVVYDQAIAGLPSTLRTVDPSPAQSCGRSGELPQNIIPLFDKSGFDRGEINRLNFITRVISTKSLEEMVEDIEGGADVQDTLAAWMMENAHINIYDDELPEADEDGAAAGDSADSAGAR
ncbi:hypothetical protein [Corynebacterium sp. MSK008]|uniref:hypothetical protein n=1 Tax=Corynebacterium sp. MSK008 TaxID=3050188 RepID=UPI002551A553|nr:hypothetical protein [Corynebacterium sp. MSK008]MDK8878843.1 hypothetical protein [Corynebacterium sp. MSK008]